MLTDTSQTGPDNTKFTAPWYVLRECVRAEESRQTFEVNRYNHFKNAVKGELWDLLLTDFTSRQYGLRARMTFFFLNFYATPSSNVNDDLLMYKQYHTIFDGALGNWRCIAFLLPPQSISRNIKSVCRHSGTRALGHSIAMQPLQAGVCLIML